MASPSNFVVDTPSFDNPKNFADAGMYGLQPGLDKGKHFWKLAGTGPVVYLRWATKWTQWVFDDDKEDAQAIAWLPADAGSAEPATGRFLDKWKFGTTAGNNGVKVPELRVSKACRCDACTSCGAGALVAAACTPTTDARCACAPGRWGRPVDACWPVDACAIGDDVATRTDGARRRSGQDAQSRRVGARRRPAGRQQRHSWGRNDGGRVPGVPRRPGEG